MSDEITVVIKGPNGSGRTVLAAKLKLFLEQNGFENVHTVDPGDKVDDSIGNLLQKQITIVESGG